MGHGDSTSTGSSRPVDEVVLITTASLAGTECMVLESITHREHCRVVDHGHEHVVIVMSISLTAL